MLLQHAKFYQLLQTSHLLITDFSLFPFSNRRHVLDEGALYWELTLVYLRLVIANTCWIKELFLIPSLPWRRIWRTKERREEGNIVLLVHEACYHTGICLVLEQSKKEEEWESHLPSRIAVALGLPSKRWVLRRIRRTRLTSRYISYGLTNSNAGFRGTLFRHAVKTYLDFSPKK